MVSAKPTGRTSVRRLPPSNFGEQLIADGGLPRELQARIEAIERGEELRPQAVRPRRSPARDWLLVALQAATFLTLVWGLMAVVVLLDALLAVAR